jgi:hypothetical protein
VALHHSEQRPWRTSNRRPVPSLQFGKRGWFYEQWRDGEGYQRVKRTALDCPRISPAFLEKERTRLGPLMFAQEYMCEFVDPGASAFSSELIDACLSHESVAQLKPKDLIGKRNRVSGSSSMTNSAPCGMPPARWATHTVFYSGS